MLLFVRKLHREVTEGVKSGRGEKSGKGSPMSVVTEAVLDAVGGSRGRRWDESAKIQRAVLRTHNFEKPVCGK